ncbi:hypothetical protein [Skermania piniformis]|uniref:Uncharacterized protein n=1 Tax=Skermania pinensis TaxID=39122 RepID=A0ABX8S4W5_9ACTN|nr:hypothetical protein [Skermania piniformis]QXQ12880.1 hypothetical protein KV203_13250 [Skermania piniformis]
MTSEFESRKDMIQELTESGAGHIGNIAQIIAGAVRDVTKEIGDWVTDGIEMREAKQRADADRATPDSD